MQKFTNKFYFLHSIFSFNIYIFPLLIPVAVTPNLRQMHRSPPLGSQQVCDAEVFETQPLNRRGGGRYHLPQGNQGRRDQRSRGFRIHTHGKYGRSEQKLTNVLV